MTCSETEPAGTRPGQRTIAGMRRPPSSSSPFMPLNGQVSENRSPPLSLVKIDDRVAASARASSSACSTRPMFASRLCTIARVGLLRAAVVVPDAVSIRFDSASSSGPSHGQCGAVKCRLSRNGSFDWRSPRSSAPPGRRADSSCSRTRSTGTSCSKSGARGLAAVIEIVRRPPEDAEELVVAALERTEVRQKAEMPFADEASCRSRPS